MKEISTDKRKGIDEFLCFPKYLRWFEILNSYRNAFFHHGWLHGNNINYIGNNKNKFQLSRNNAFLLPDWESIKSNSKPSNWSWENGYQLFDIAKLSLDGLKDLINDLCSNYWSIPVPAPGEISVEEHPNLLLRIVKPLLFKTPQLVIPIYTSVDLAYKNVPTMDSDKHEIAELNCKIEDERSIFNLSLSGIDHKEKVLILIDPIYKNNILQSENYDELDLSKMKLKEKLEQFGLSIEGEYKKVYVWRGIQLNQSPYC